MNLTKISVWQALKQHAKKLKKKTVASLFSEDPQRFQNFSLSVQGITLDYSKNPINKKTLRLLFELADAIKLKQQINYLFSGQKINTTMHIPALHTALRDPRPSGLILDGKDLLYNVHKALEKMQAFVEQVHTHRWRGCTGKKITDIVHLGMGGSELGPFMTIYALKAYQAIPLHFHFISIVDDLIELLSSEQINLENTLFIIASKSFSTFETLFNATQAFKLFQKKFPKKRSKQHFVAITSHVKKAIEFGIDPDNIFPIWSWVGGRYSLWSSVGLSIALAIGMPGFRELLRGGHSMDQHFLSQPWLSNMPVLLGLLGIWQRNFFACDAHIVLPYDTRLKYFPMYLQQLEMESNGKSTRIDGKPVHYKTCPYVFGELGLNAQHAFSQLFHQGTAHFSADFLISLRHPNPTLHRYLVANALSQSRILMEGYYDPLFPYKTTSGNHANNLLAFTELTPFNLGRLIALYEHKVFVQAAVWQINPFDQWGVEYGKQLSERIYKQLNTPLHNIIDPPLDSSTVALMKLYQTSNNPNKCD